MGLLNVSRKLGSVPAETRADAARRAERIVDRLLSLAAISEDEGRLTRTFGSDEMRRANELVGLWMRQAGLKTSVDAIGNLRARTIGSAPRRLLLGSHLDTVRDAGKFDGALGVLLALEALAARPLLSYDVELLAFSDEEGARFQSTYLGSRAVAGTFDPATLALHDERGISLEQAIRDFGGDPAQIAACRVAAEEIVGYAEIHLEQGPVLERLGEPLGVVRAIAGQTRVALEFIGHADHAGTTPMRLRRDALAAAAEFILAAEACAKSRSSLVATVGQIEVPNSASNVVPGRVALTLDVRASDDPSRRRAVAALERAAGEISRGRRSSLIWRIVQESPAAACDPDLRLEWADAIAETGHQPQELVSGAGHDAAAFIHAGIPSAMLFVRCRDGLSHHPDEFVAPADIATALLATDQFLQRLSGSEALR